MTRPAPRALRDVPTRRPAVRTALTALVLAVAALVAPAGVAIADDDTAAWSVAPSDAQGAPTGTTRFELEADASAPVTEHVLLTNSSTVERAFNVYAADGFNTSDGGYDLGAASVTPTGVGAWTAVAGSPVTVPALSTKVVEFTVTVPKDATPGDHPGGIVVSPVRPQPDASGVVVDTRVAVRLNVRVPGEVTAALDIRSLGASYGFSAVPFGSADATLRYEVVNTGNVKVVGVPRVRITGPFGVTLAEVEADKTREVLPGDSFEVSTTLSGIAPLVYDTATVDVSMTAAPGPDTEIPAVSATARTSFIAVPWTGLALLVVLGVAAWFAVRWWRRRRLETARAWDRVVDEARADLEAGRAPRSAGALGVVAVATLLAGGLLLGGPPAARADDGAITITVPKATASPAPTPRASTTPRSPRPAQVLPDPSPSPSASGEVPGTGGKPSTPPASAEAPPDLVWPERGHRWTTSEWVLVGVGGAGALGAAGWGLLRHLSTRRMVGA